MEITYASWEVGILTARVTDHEGAIVIENDTDRCSVPELKIFLSARQAWNFKYTLDQALLALKPEEEVPELAEWQKVQTNA